MAVTQLMDFVVEMDNRVFLSLAGLGKSYSATNMNRLNQYHVLKRVISNEIEVRGCYLVSRLFEIFTLSETPGNGPPGRQIRAPNWRVSISVASVPSSFLREGKTILVAEIKKTRREQTHRMIFVLAWEYVFYNVQLFSFS